MRIAIGILLCASCAPEFSEGIEFPPNVSETFHVVGTSENDLWTLTEPPFYWNGSSWSQVFTKVGIAESAGLSLLLSDDGLEVSRISPAAEQERFATPTQMHALNKIGDEVWGFGIDGSVYRVDGTTWSELRPAGEPQVNGVIGAPTRALGVAGNGDILHYDGTTWTAETPPFLADAFLDGIAAGDDFYAYNEFVPGGSPPELIWWDGEFQKVPVELESTPEKTHVAQRAVSTSDGQPALIVQRKEFRDRVPFDIGHAIMRFDGASFAEQEIVVRHNACGDSCAVDVTGGNAFVSALTPELYAISWSFGPDPRLYVLSIP